MRKDYKVSIYTWFVKDLYFEDLAWISLAFCVIISVMIWLWGGGTNPCNFIQCVIVNSIRCYLPLNHTKVPSKSLTTFP